MVPDFDHPFRCASNEDRGHVLVPSNVVNRRVMCWISLQIFGTVFGGAFVDDSLVGPNEEHGLVCRVEIYASATLYKKQ